MSHSPYELVLGELIGDLSPRLRTYFSAIPAGSVGEGTGVFDRVGTPRKWLWPVLRLLARDGVIVPVWAKDVPFTVVNTPLDGAVAATRTFRFVTGDWHMTDEIGVHRDGLVDVLGRSRRLAALLDASVANGGLVLRSSGLQVRVGNIRGLPAWLAVPSFVAPRVTLTERFDDGDGRQHVGLSLTLPLLGRIYEYSGSFTYEIRTAKGDQ